MFDNVILALNAEADIAAAQALLAKLATPIATVIHIVCVVNPEFALVTKPGETLKEAKEDSEEYPAAAQEETQAHLLVAKQVESFKMLGKSVMAEIVAGEPAHEIVDYAKAHQADLILMSRRHLSWFGRLREPSVCNYVIEHAVCPVLIIPSRSGK